MKAQMFRGLVVLALAAFPAVAVTRSPSAATWDSPHAGNPLLPGYVADPSVLHHEGRWYIYATIDPWGGDRLAAWESSDFVHWTYHELNWPTKAAATSATSRANKVWAPSVVRGSDGRFWMYVSVGSEIWVGVADAPLGPWRDALGGRPLVQGNYRPGFHMIDAEAFIDDDGQAYLYWGSGLDWVNGHCFAVKLKPDMVSFDGVPVDVTPANYFEAPFMVKEKDRYYLTYSNGKTTEDTYEVRYAVGKSPLGPFTEADNSPILSTDASRQIISPGHHAIFRDDGKTYILYHRQALPFAIGKGDLLRQVAVDRLRFESAGIAKVWPTHDGFHPGHAQRAGSLPIAVSASGEVDREHGANRVHDDNYATLWRATAPADAPSTAPWIQADLGKIMSVSESVILPEYPGKATKLAMMASIDGHAWTDVAPMEDRTGSPIRISHRMKVRYLRLITQPDTGIFEWSVKGR